MDVSLVVCTCICRCVITPHIGGGINQSVFSVCRLASVHQKNYNLAIYRVERLATNILKINIDVCTPTRDHSSSILHISSSFLFNINIIRHFNVVNNLNTCRHMWALDTMSCSYPSIQCQHADCRVTNYSAQGKYSPVFSLGFFRVVVHTTLFVRLYTTWFEWQL